MCESFSVDASLGVVVRVCGADPVESREKPAAPRWPLSRPTDVLVAMTSPNFAEDEGKVGLGRGGRYVGRTSSLQVTILIYQIWIFP